MAVFISYFLARGHKTSMCLNLIGAVQTLSSALLPAHYFSPSLPLPLIKVHPHPRKLPFLFMSLSFSWRHFAHAGVRSEPAAPFIRHTYSELLTSTWCQILESTSMKIPEFIQLWVTSSLSILMNPMVNETPTI